MNCIKCHKILGSTINYWQGHPVCDFCFNFLTKPVKSNIGKPVKKGLLILGYIVLAVLCVLGCYVIQEVYF